MGALGVSEEWTPIWKSETSGKGICRIVMQTDGNLVLYQFSDETYTQNMEPLGHRVPILI